MVWNCPMSRYENKLNRKKKPNQNGSDPNLETIFHRSSFTTQEIHLQLSVQHSFKSLTAVRCRKNRLRDTHTHTAAMRGKSGTEAVEIWTNALEWSCRWLEDMLKLYQSFSSHSPNTHQTGEIKEIDLKLISLQIKYLIDRVSILISHLRESCWISACVVSLSPSSPWGWSSA